MVILHLVGFRVRARFRGAVEKQFRFFNEREIMVRDDFREEAVQHHTELEFVLPQAPTMGSWSWSWGWGWGWGGGGGGKKITTAPATATAAAHAAVLLSTATTIIAVFIIRSFAVVLEEATTRIHRVRWKCFVDVGDIDAGFVRGTCVTGSDDVVDLRFLFLFFLISFCSFGINTHRCERGRRREKSSPKTTTTTKLPTNKRHTTIKTPTH